jgi:hypothetical protein
MSEEEKRQHERLLMSWMAGAIRHDHIMESAACKLQRMARAWLTRKTVRDGKFLRDAAKGWVEAHPPPPLSSTEATMSLQKLMTLARVFSLVPTVLSEAEVLDMFYRLTATCVPLLRSVRLEQILQTHV